MKLDEKGIAVNYGWTCIAQDGDEEIWGTVTVDEDEVVEFLHRSAAQHLPPGSRYELRRIPGFYGRSFGMAWFWTPDFEKASEWTNTPQSERGYVLVGRFTTPTAKAA